MKAIQVSRVGGPEELRPVERPEPTPKAGEVLVRVEYAGVNFIDVYQRSGQYPVPTPFVPGQEGAGVVESVGAGVAGLAPGDRVAWAGAVLGSYAEKAVLPAERLVRLPAGLAPRLAAAVLLQGLTAHYLATSTRPLSRGDTCLIHAAAGGVGALLVQMAKKRGARVFGTVSNDAKAKHAAQMGADSVIRYDREDFAAAVREATQGRGVDVVYDSVGRTSFDKSLDSLARRGMLVLFGQSSGAVPPVDPQLLSKKGSLYLTRPTLAHYTAEPAELVARAADLLGWVADGSLRVTIAAELPLAEAERAHRLLESRAPLGKIILGSGL